MTPVRQAQPHPVRPGPPYRYRGALRHRDHGRAARVAAAVASAVVLLSVLFGLPIGLLIVQRAVWQNFDVAAAGEQPLTLPVLVLAGVGCGWLLWGWLVAATIADAAAVMTRGPRQPRLLPAPLRATVAVLAGSLLVATTTSTANAAAPATSTSTHTIDPLTPAATPAAAETVTAPPRLTVAAAAGTASPARSTVQRRATVHVQRGDSLWKISKQELGDPRQWPAIFRLNQGRLQANGYALTDPDELHVGWVLALPTADPAPAVPDTGPADTDASTTTETTPGATTSPAPANTPGTTAPTANPSPTQGTQHHTDRHRGVHLPSQGWISLGLAATIAAVAGLLRLHRRRHAHLSSPIPVSTGPTRPPIPADLALADAVGRRDLHTDPDLTDDQPRPAARLAPPVLNAPIGVDASGAEMSLFDLPGPGLALHGPGTEAAARAILASALATGVRGLPALRPIVVTTPDTLARLLPHGADPAGLDPNGATFDGERLLVLADTAAAVTHAEEEMIGRRRLLDTIDAPSIADLNARTDHIEHQPPYVLLVGSDPRNAGRIAAIGAHRAALHLHPVILGDNDTMTALTIAADGTLPDGGRCSTLTATDLGQLLAIIAEAAARPEPGTDIDEPEACSDEPCDAGHPGDAAGTSETAAAAGLASVPDLPAAPGDAPALVRLTVLGPVTVATDTGPVTTGMRRGSYAALALLAAYPHGRTLRQIAADLYPDADPDAAVKRVRTDITTARRVLRTASGAPWATFIVYDPATGRYRLDPGTIEVDLWRMLTAVDRANTAIDDTAALTALREAADLYAGDFADGQDRAWVTDYATTHRHQILSVYTRIAEHLEADQPDAAVAALETALRHDPVNEELYQRIIRIHGRQHRPDAVRRTLRRLEAQLTELGDAEPSDATRRLVERQLRAVPAGARP